MNVRHFSFRRTLAALFFSLTRLAGSKDKTVPLSYEDSEHADEPLLVWTPTLTKSIEQQPVVLGVVLFDGTKNDRTRVPTGERQTVIGHLYDVLQSPERAIYHYYAGAGTQPGRLASRWDAAIGSSVKGTAEKAVDEVVSKITTLRQCNPDSDVRLLVSGFSRGAAAARHFMNTFDRRWDAQQRIGTPPRFYALIFDTVATGQRGNLQLQVSKRADFFYHFVSTDERRVFFSSICDRPIFDPDGRVVTLRRPGVHSDIGGAYSTGIGSEYIVVIDALLSRMGLILNRHFEIDGDVRSQGKNDSRWTIDRALGIGSPNSLTTPKTRNTTYIPVQPLSDACRKQWQRRMFALSDNGGISMSQTNRMIYSFSVTRVTDTFTIDSITPLISLTQTIHRSDTGYVITIFSGKATLGSVPISSTILDSLTEGRSTRLDLSSINRSDGSTELWWFTNNIRREKIEGFIRRQ